MGKRILITLCVAAFGATAWWLMRPGQAPDEGLVVDVEVLDLDGQVLPKAQVQATFRPGWQSVNAAGQRRLTNLTLRADEDVSAKALMAAVSVRARFYTLRRGFEPQIERQQDGSWRMRFALHHHGVLRLSVADTHFGEVKAFLEPDPLNRWEAMDRGNVARPGLPAAYRIYPGFQKIAVQLRGEPDKQGAVGVATRRFFLSPPASGHIIERTVEPDAVMPILGSIVPPEGPPPPTLAGSVRVTEITADGSRIAHEAVAIERDGSFVIRTVGAGDYELEAHVAFFAEPLTTLVAGGGLAEMRLERPAYWAVVAHPGLDLSLRKGLFTRQVPEEAEARPVAALFGKNTSLVPLPGAGTYALRLAVTGTNAAKPLDGDCLIVALDPGPANVRLEWQEAPSGTLVVHTTKASWEHARGATVRVQGREATLMHGLREGVTFKNIRIVTDVEYPGLRVVIDWDDPTAAPSHALLKLEPGGTLPVTLARETGGRLNVRVLSPPFAQRESRLPLQLWYIIEDGSRPAGPRFSPPNQRRGSLPIWEVGERLLPGRYGGAVREKEPPGLWEWDFEFDIQAGETTLVDVQVK